MKRINELYVRSVRSVRSVRFIVMHIGMVLAFWIILLSIGWLQYHFAFITLGIGIGILLDQLFYEFF
jgi:hypothetical protein